MKPRTCDTRVPIPGAEPRVHNATVSFTDRCNRPLLIEVPLEPRGKISRVVQWRHLPNGLIGLMVEAPFLSGMIGNENGLMGEQMHRAILRCTNGHIRALYKDEFLVWSRSVRQT